MQDILIIESHIDPSQQGSYFTIPFSVPDGIEALSLSYRYERRLMEEQPIPGGSFTNRSEANIIDLGLIDPNGLQVGASGSDKTDVTLSETQATPGYTPCIILPGEWHILVGAYKVAPEGVSVQFEVRLQHKEIRLLKGDLHTHTLASDGVHSMEELAIKAQRNGLDFLAITDHNQMVSVDALPRRPGVTMIPGIEWTHYQGHASFLGLSQPYDGVFATHTPEEAIALFNSARKRGALIIIDHPFDQNCGFHLDWNALSFDCLEVWNGPMREYNLQAVEYWQRLLCAGKKIPICGGSDYHRDTPFIFLGGPTTCVYTLSAGPSDILAALRAGHSYITFAPNGPELSLTAGKAIMGDAVPWADSHELHITASGLLAGDVVRLITPTQADPIFKAPTDGDLSIDYPIEAPGFARLEILRSFIPGLPMLPALLSNPIYFDPAP
ncbi:MAG: CehA/McbA family metallohydrolase [Anaerolineales bacterium]|nr:CehA/McbA family metallohydrolase [Anaerolineales bacterium]